MLLSTVFIAIAGGLFTVVRVTKTNEQVQKVDSALITYGEIIRTQIDYAPCAGGFVEGAVASRYADDARDRIDDATDLGRWARPPYMLTDILRVESWDPVARTFIAGCRIPDTGIQRITYSVIQREPIVEYPEPWRASDWKEVAVSEGQVVKRMAGRS